MVMRAGAMWRASGLARLQAPRFSSGTGLRPVWSHAFVCFPLKHRSLCEMRGQGCRRNEHIGGPAECRSDRASAGALRRPND